MTGVLSVTGSSVTGRTVWTAVCHVEDLVPERGAVALVGDEQIALFRLHSAGAGAGAGAGSPETVLGVQQLDPFCGAHVMARGIVGSRGEVPTVASPMYKQVFDLRTGTCLDAVGREPVVGGPDLRTWPVRVEAGLVLVGTPVDRALRDRAVVDQPAVDPPVVEQAVVAGSGPGGGLP